MPTQTLLSMNLVRRTPESADADMVTGRISARGTVVFIILLTITDDSQQHRMDERAAALGAGCIGGGCGAEGGGCAGAGWVRTGG